MAELLEDVLTTTTEPSTIKPIAIPRPSSDIRLAEMLRWFITAKVSNGIRIRVAITTMFDRMSPRKRNRITTPR
jgi:hypothetical protein